MMTSGESIDLHEIKQELRLLNNLMFTQVTLMYEVCSVLNHDKKTAEHLNKLYTEATNQFSKHVTNRE